MASQARDNEKYRKEKRKRLQRFALQMTQAHAGRTCAGCTACCFVMGVAEVPTPFYSPCPHIKNGGCDIYGKHPGACRDFYCEWLVGRAGPDDRPDRLGLLFVANRLRNADGSDRMFVTAYEVWPGAADTDRGRAVLRSMGPEIGLFRYGDMSRCVDVGTGRRIIPDIADCVRPPDGILADPRPGGWERGGSGQP
jgi:hypothetical protein